MKEWKYLIGSADDFIGAPEWCTHIIKSDASHKLAYESSDRAVKGNPWAWVGDGSVMQRYDQFVSGRVFTEIIAQRTESFGNAIDLEFCKANPDHPDCMCKAGFVNGAFKHSKAQIKDALANGAMEVIMNHKTYLISAEEPKATDANVGTVSYKVDLDLTGVDDVVAKNYYKKRAAYLAKKNKYARICKGLPVDVYDVLRAFAVTNPATQHAIKKLLCAGLRGHKDKMQDLTEALKSIERAIELEKE